MLDAAGDGSPDRPRPLPSAGRGTARWRPTAIRCCRRRVPARTAADARTRAIAAELRPDIALTATFSGRAGTATPSTGPLVAGLRPAADGPELGRGARPALAAVSIPSWPRGATRPLRAPRSRAPTSRSLSQQETAAVQQAYVTRRSRRSRWSRCAASVEAAQANYAQAEARFKAGLGTSLELADAEALRTDAEIQLAVGEYDVQRARAALTRVLAEEELTAREEPDDRRDRPEATRPHAACRWPSPPARPAVVALGVLLVARAERARQRRRAGQHAEAGHGRRGARRPYRPLRRYVGTIEPWVRGEGRAAADLGLRGHRAGSAGRRRQARAGARHARLPQRLGVVEGRRDAGARPPGPAGGARPRGRARRRAEGGRLRLAERDREARRRQRQQGRRADGDPGARCSGRRSRSTTASCARRSRARSRRVSSTRARSCVPGHAVAIPRRPPHGARRRRGPRGRLRRRGARDAGADASRWRRTGRCRATIARRSPAADLVHPHGPHRDRRARSRPRAAGRHHRRADASTSAQPQPPTEIPLVAASVRGEKATVFVVDGAASRTRRCLAVLGRARRQPVPRRRRCRRARASSPKGARC